MEGEIDWKARAEKAEARANEAELRLGNWSVQHELDEANAKLANFAKQVRCMYCNELYTIEDKDKLADHILSCEKSPLVQMVKEMESRITDYMDMVIDEFTRIVALTDNTEIVGICQRAMTVIAQKEPVIKQRDDAIKERDAAKAECERLRKALRPVFALLPIPPNAITYELGWKIIDAIVDAKSAIGKEGA